MTKPLLNKQTTNRLKLLIKFSKLLGSLTSSRLHALDIMNAIKVPRWKLDEEE